MLMKTKGIIRRVDNLGRVVIPREYRKLHRIFLGDPMEISCTENGEIILRKIDTTLTLEEYSAPLVKLLSEQLSGTVLVSNLEFFVLGCGSEKNAFVGKDLPIDVRLSLGERKNISLDGIPSEWNLSGFERKSMIGEIILGESDIFGGLFLVKDGACSADDTLILKLTAAVLASSLQKY